MARRSHWVTSFILATRYNRWKSGTSERTWRARGLSFALYARAESLRQINKFRLFRENEKKTRRDEAGAIFETTERFYCENAHVFFIYRNRVFFSSLVIFIFTFTYIIYSVCIVRTYICLGKRSNCDVNSLLSHFHYKWKMRDETSSLLANVEMMRLYVIIIKREIRHARERNRESESRKIKT